MRPPRWWGFGLLMLALIGLNAFVLIWFWP